MNIDIKNNTNFTGIYYVKYPISQSNRKLLPLINSMNVKPILDNNPNPQISNAVESSDFFKKLSQETDIFISTTKTQKHKRNVITEFTAYFTDPFSTNKGDITTLGLISEDIKESNTWTQLASLIKNLKDYSSLRKTIDTKYNTQIISIDKEPVGYFTIHKQ